MSEPLFLYKLMVLFMLKISKVPLTNTMITTFFLEKDYTSYFTIQEVLYELDKSQFIVPEPTYSNIHYSLTPAGQESLDFFGDKINAEVQKEIRQFIVDNQVSIEDASTTHSEYYLTPEKRYAVHCQILEKGIPKLDLTLTVPNKAQAEIICANWKNQTLEIYALLMDQLLK